ncbi:unnamed protein product [Caretta caretta]
MTTGLSEDLQQINDGKSSEETREHGVGFAIKNSLLEVSEPPTNGSERILALRLFTSEGPVNLVSEYAPTLSSSSDIKDQFYNQLNTTTSKIPKHEYVFLVGEFNVKLGADHEAWTNCLGQHRIGKMNGNGQRLLEFCSYYDLCVTNSILPDKVAKKCLGNIPDLATGTNWILPLQGVLTLTSSSFPTVIKVLIVTQITLCAIVDQEKSQQYKNILQQSLDTSNCATSTQLTWEQLKNTIHDAALSVFGKKENKTNNWFDTYSSVLTPVIEVKHRAQTNYKRDSNEKTLQT